MTELINVVYEPVETEWGVDVGEAGVPSPIPTELVLLVAGVGLMAMMVAFVRFK